MPNIHIVRLAVLTAPLEASASIWILANGTWNDAGVWDDVETWNDS